MGSHRAMAALGRAHRAHGWALYADCWRKTNFRWAPSALPRGNRPLRCRVRRLGGAQRTEGMPRPPLLASGAGFAVSPGGLRRAPARQLFVGEAQRAGLFDEEGGEEVAIGRRNLIYKLAGSRRPVPHREGAPSPIVLVAAPVPTAEGRRGIGRRVAVAPAGGWRARGSGR